MFQRHVANRLRLGRFLGIDLFIHWTFWILLFGVAGVQVFSGGVSNPAAWQSAGYAVAQISMLFICVTLHEYGHALMARKFNVRTIDITLLPIGGLARLERMPRRPMEEFLVAVAGPAVNVVIAGLTVPALVWVCRSQDAATPEEWITVASEHPLGWLMAVNLALVVFNMIPAFPMDGGRVLRALLASFTNYAKATYIASRIGFVIGFLMATAGLLNGQPMVVLISMFIGYAGWMEAKQVMMSERLSQFRIDAWVQPVEIQLTATDTLPEMMRAFSATQLPCLPVIGVNDQFLGLVDRSSFSRALAVGIEQVHATDLMRSDEPMLVVPGSLETQIGELTQSPFDVVAVVNEAGTFVGLISVQQVLRSIFSRTVNPPVAGREEGNSQTAWLDQRA